MKVAFTYLDSLERRRVSSGSMKLPRPSDRRLLAVLVVLTVWALLGHICALPAEAEWAAIATHGATSSAEPHDSAGAHADIASCDATLSKPARILSPSLDSAAVISSSSIAAAPPMLVRDAKPQRVIAPRRAPDRSLLLLHSSLLI